MNYLSSIREMAGSLWDLKIPLAIAVALSSQISAQEREILSIPMFIEEAEVFTQMHIGLVRKDLDTPLLSFAPESTEEGRMQKFFLDILQGDLGAALAMTDEPQGTNRQEAMPILEAYSDLLAPVAETIQLQSVAHIGEERLFVWSVPVEQTESDYPTMVRSFRFVRPQSGGDLFFEGIAREPVSILVTSLLHESQRFSGGEPPRSDPSAFEFDYAVPGTENGDEVRFYFDGRMVDFDAYDASATVSGDLETFFISAMQSFESGNAEAFSEYWTPFSRDRLLSWRQEIGDEAYAAFVSDNLQIGKRVLFILNADPVYFLLSLPTMQGVEGAAFRYDTVMRTPEGGYKLVNFFTEGFFDDILKERGLFEEPFLRPLLRGAGVLLSAGNRPTQITPPSSSPAQVSAQAEPGEEKESESGVAVLEKETSKGIPWYIFLIIALVLGGLIYQAVRRRSESES